MTLSPNRLHFAVAALIAFVSARFLLGKEPHSGGAESEAAAEGSTAD